MEGSFDMNDFQTLRSAIFVNFQKNLWEKKNLSEYQKQKTLQVYQKENFTDQEWTQIEKDIKKLGLEISSTSNKNETNSNSNSPHIPILIILFLTGLIILISGGLWIIKKEGSEKKK
ncbi:MAG: hypothetical protein MRERC_12c032 [Mycoplasmataceae bacterium RC_NB112A]|nr:MAG: hypothetical protein MRERC_12c032 [Mycoplasmataceae bacterium RC_NB112A]